MVTVCWHQQEGKNNWHKLQNVNVTTAVIFSHHLESKKLKKKKKSYFPHWGGVLKTQHVLKEETLSVKRPRANTFSRLATPSHCAMGPGETPKQVWANPASNKGLRAVLQIKRGRISPLRCGHLASMWKITRLKTNSDSPGPRAGRLFWVDVGCPRSPNLVLFSSNKWVRKRGGKFSTED